MDPQPTYPFAEVEARWRRSPSARPDRDLPADASKAAVKHYIYPWPAPFSVGGRADLSIERRWVLADTLARLQGHRAQAPVVPIVVDGFAPAPPGGRPADRARECLETLEIRRTGEVVDTTAPAFYRFTQWIFLELHLKGLAARILKRVDACTRCGRKYRFGSLASCRACQGEISERRESEWWIDISGYGERLVQDLEGGQWPREEMLGQKDVLGRVRGSEVSFQVSRLFEDEYAELVVFTTHVERIFGVTFILVDPYHPIVEAVLDPAYEDDVARYRERLRKGAEPRISAARTGGFALNPANLRRIPILVSPLASVPPSDGAVMAVPAHDPELWELAKRLKLPIREVIHNDKAKFDSQSRLEEPWLGDGVLTNSGSFTSLPVRVGRDRVIGLLNRKGCCQRATRFRRSRLLAAAQGVWGPPVPVVHCKRCGIVPVPEHELPVELPPELAAGPVEGGLAASKRFVRASCPACGEAAARDADGILPWLGTAWAYLRALLPGLDGPVEGFQGQAPGEVRPEATSSDATREAPAPATPAVPAREAPPEERAPEAAQAPDSSVPSSPAPHLDVLPEDIDIFAVPSAAPAAAGDPAQESAQESAEEPAEEPAEGPGGEEERPAEPDAAAGGSGEEGEGPVAPPEAAPGGEAAAVARGAIEPDLASTTVEEALPQQSPRGTPAKEPGPAKGLEGGGEEADDEDDGEEEAADRLSSLRPFSGPFVPALLPVDTAIGAGSLRPGDILAVRFLARFLQETGHSPVAEPFRRYLRAGAVQVGPPPAVPPPKSPAKGAAGPAEKARPGDGGRGPPGGAPAAGEEPRSLSELAGRFGADAVRLCLLFGGPPPRPIAVDVHRARCMQRFLDRIWRQMLLRRERGRYVSRRMLVEKHQMIHRVTERLQAGKPHTAVAALMRFVRFLEDRETAPEDMDRFAMRTFIILLSPFAPFLARELWAAMGETDDLATAPWPVASDELVHPPEREFPIFVDGRLRDRMQQPASLEPEKLESRALQRDRIRELVGSRRVERVVVVPQRLVSIVLATEPPRQG
ncbi:MAG: class I tRNA ligase family protein [Planctomycetes bacterium]|nr:class I tRNA ligase family protein [Planctomycetota bacterium]